MIRKNSPKARKAKPKGTIRPKKAPGKWPMVVKLFVQLSLVAACLLFFWLIYLNAIVREGFEGRRFKIPARVYSEAQELYVGASISQDSLVALLQKLGYRAADEAFQAGRYSVRGARVSVFTRGFNFWDGVEPAGKIALQFNANGITGLAAENGQTLPLVRLDPLYIGQIYPGITEDRVPYSLDTIPERLVLGLVLVEDERYFQHWGISFRGIARALFANISSGQASQGGSTLTNQLVKNMYLTSDKTLTRKIKEALMSVIMEMHYSKNDILETYMNEVYIGQQGARAINGFGLGAEFYFGTTLEGLQIHQQAMLIGLIKGPSYYNPRRHPKRAKSRRDTVLSVWLRQGLITQAEYRQASSAALDIASKPRQSNYPAFMDALRRQLANDYRKEDLLGEGLTIFTTLDPLAQTILEQQVAETLPKTEQRFKLAANILEAAAVLTRPSTGDILAILGGREPRAGGFNRALDAKRPIGSLMKPAVYLAALEQGYSLAEPLNDADVTIAAGDGTFWQPKNYDRIAHGQPMLVDALAKSYNQATARLGMQIGLVGVFDVIARLGVSDSIPLVPAVMLGAHGMSPMEVAQMYQTISGNGFYSPLNTIRAVSHPQLGVIQRYDLKVSQRFSPEAIYLLQAAMHEATVMGTSASIQWLLPSHWWAAGKTGTTDDNRDAWFSGFTGDRQLVVWVGRDNNKTTPLTGSTGALPIWIKVMAELRPEQERRSVPLGITQLDVNEAGIVVPSGCDNARSLPFILGTEPVASMSCNEQDNRAVPRKSTWWQKLFN
mgnify:FL=1